MNDSDDSPSTHDVLFSRVVDRTAAPADFDALLSAAQSVPDTLRQLVLALRDDSALHAGVEAELDLADGVMLPVAPVLQLGRPGHAGPSWRAWSGWAAAALLAVCWLGSGRTSPAQPAHAPQQPHAVLPLAGGSSAVALRDTGAADRDLGTAPSALQKPRLREGQTEDPRPLGELPLKLVSMQPASDGPGYEVVVLRRLLESTRVDNLLSLGVDDAGRPAPVFVDPAMLAKADSY
jgi:hypothetical protein